MHPLLTELLARERAKDMLARAEHQRRVRAAAAPRIETKTRWAWLAGRPKPETAPLRRNPAHGPFGARPSPARLLRHDSS